MKNTREISDYVIYQLSSAGQPCTFQHLQDLLFAVQGYALAVTGQAAFLECFKVFEDGPRLPSMCTSGNLESLSPVSGTLQPVILEPGMAGLVNAVLRKHAGSAFALNHWIKASPLWSHSRAEGRVDLANMAAFFKKLAPLSLGTEAYPTVSPWPFVYEEGNEYAIFAQMRAEAAAQIGQG